MDKNITKIQKYVYIGFLLAGCLALVASFLFIGNDWFVLKSAIGTSESFYDALEGQIYLAEDKGLILSSLRPFANSTNSYSYVFENISEGIQFYRGLWSTIQLTNNLLFYTGLFAVVCTAVTGVFGQYGNRKFYKSNLISGLIASGVTAVLSIVSMVLGFVTLSKVAEISPDIDAYNFASNALATSNGATYKNIVISSANTTLVIVAAFIMLALSVLFGLFTVYKFKKSQQPRLEVSGNE